MHADSLQTNNSCRRTFAASKVFSSRSTEVCSVGTSDRASLTSFGFGTGGGSGAVLLAAPSVLFSAALPADSDAGSSALGFRLLRSLVGLRACVLLLLVIGHTVVALAAGRLLGAASQRGEHVGERVADGLEGCGLQAP